MGLWFVSAMLLGYGAYAVYVAVRQPSMFIDVAGSFTAFLVYFVAGFGACYFGGRRRA